MEKESVNSSQVLVQPPKWSDLPKVAVTGFENLMQKLPPCSCGKEDGFGNIIRAKFYCDKDCNGQFYYCEDYCMNEQHNHLPLKILQKMA